MMASDGFPDFAWVVGEEGSDPIVEAGGRLHRHDQYAQSGHYEHMTDDLGSIADLGASAVRYGMPWRRTEPAPGEYDWSLWDRALAACDRAGVEPIIDLLHFGLPDHSSGFADAVWVEDFGRYVEAFLARYREPRWFTVINEPGITAYFSARLGAWNDRLASEADHARTLANIVLANLEALARIDADRDALWIGSEGFDVPVAVGPDAEPAIETRRALGWLVWDLHLGFEPAPGAEGYLDPVADTVRDRIRTLARRERLIAGHDLYPVSVQPVGGPRPEWTTADLVALGAAELRRWHDRYRVPFWVGETSNLSLPTEEQVPWLEELASALAELRTEGLPVRGLCWYSRGDQFDWQTALLNPVGAVTEVGLFDRERRPRPVATAFRKLATG